jgi:hypothetical protein
MHAQEEANASAAASPKCRPTRGSAEEADFSSSAGANDVAMDKASEVDVASAGRIVGFGKPPILHAMPKSDMLRGQCNAASLSKGDTAAPARVPYTRRQVPAMQIWEPVQVEATVLLASIARELEAVARARIHALAGAAEPGSISECAPPQQHEVAYLTPTTRAPDLPLWLASHQKPPPGGVCLGPPDAIMGGEEGIEGSGGKAVHEVLVYLQHRAVAMPVAARMLQQLAMAPSPSGKPCADPGSVLSQGTLLPLAGELFIHHTVDSGLSGPRPYPVLGPGDKPYLCTVPGQTEMDNPVLTITRSKSVAQR